MMRMRLSTRTFALVLATLFGFSHAVRLKLNRNEHECIVEKYHGKGTEEVELDYHFFVEGKKGDLNYDYHKKVDVTVYGPPAVGSPASTAPGKREPGAQWVEIRSDKHIFQEEYQRFRSYGSGDYYLCFEQTTHNEPITVNVVYFMVREFSEHEGAEFAGSQPPAASVKNPKGTEDMRNSEAATSDDVETLQSMTVKLRSWLDELRYEQYYMRRRIERHFDTQRSMNRRTVFFALAESGAIAAVGFIQVLFIRRLFQTQMVRRAVTPPKSSPLSALPTFASTAMFGSAVPQGPSVRVGDRLVV